MEIAVKITGGVKSFPEVQAGETLKDLKRSLKEETGQSLKKYTAVANGEPVDNSYELQDQDFITFAPSVKGGRS